MQKVDIIIPLGNGSKSNNDELKILLRSEGVGMTDFIADSRNLKNDANFDQSTIAKRGTLQAARLVLRPKVMSSTISEDGKQVVVRTFVMEMADITGSTSRRLEVIIFRSVQRKNQHKKTPELLQNKQLQCFILSVINGQQVSHHRSIR